MKISITHNHATEAIEAYSKITDTGTMEYFFHEFGETIILSLRMLSNSLELLSYGNKKDNIMALYVEVPENLKNDILKYVIEKKGD